MGDEDKGDLEQMEDSPVDGVSVIIPEASMDTVDLDFSDKDDEELAKENESAKAYELAKANELARENELVAEKKAEAADKVEIAKKAEEQLLVIMAEIMAIEGIPPDPQHLLLERLNSEVPLFAKMLRDTKASNDSLLRYIDLMHKSSNLVSQAKPITDPVGVALAAVDFIRFPVVYFASWIVMGQRPPLKLTKTAQWGYAAVGLALAIVALTVPVTAPFIAIATAGAAALIGGASIYKMIKDRGNIKRELQEIDDKLKPLIDIQSRIRDLEGPLKGLNPKAPEFAEDHAKVCQQIQDEHTKYLEFKNTVPEFQELLNRKILLETKLEKLGSWALADKAAGTVLPALTALFIGLSFVFPPLILGAAAVAGVGLLYGAGRFVGPRIAPFIMPTFNNIRSWFAERFGSSNEEKPIPAPSNAPKPHFDKEKIQEVGKEKQEIHGSTLNIATLLAKHMGTDVVKDLQAAVQHLDDDTLNKEPVVASKQVAEDDEAVVDDKDEKSKVDDDNEEFMA